MSYIYKSGRKYGNNVNINGDKFEELYLDLPQYQTSDTTDKAIYDAIVALSWDSDVLIG